MTHSFHRREILSESVKTCFKKIIVNNSTDLHDPTTLVHACFDGSVESLHVCCGNLTSSRAFREYGLHSTIMLVLRVFCEQFDDLQVNSFETLWVAHGATMLLSISNTSPSAVHNNVGFFDIAELTDTASGLALKFLDEEKGSDIVNVKTEEYCEQSLRRTTQKQDACILAFTVSLIFLVFSLYGRVQN